MADKVQVQEHSQTAQVFIVDANREFASGDLVQGSEKLWGAASHAVMAVAQQRGWNYRSHRSLKNAAIQLSREQNDPTIEAYFAVAEKFHRNFYHDDMEDWERDADKPLVERFVARVLTLLEQWEANTPR